MWVAENSIEWRREKDDLKKRKKKTVFQLPFGLFLGSFQSLGRESFNF